MTMTKMMMLRCFKKIVFTCTFLNISHLLGESAVLKEFVYI